jgi:hypothetical protein
VIFAPSVCMSLSFYVAPNLIFLTKPTSRICFSFCIVEMDINCHGPPFLLKLRHAFVFFR